MSEGETYDRIRTKPATKSIGLKLFLIACNLYIAFILSQIDVFQYVGLGVIVLTGISLIVSATNGSKLKIKMPQYGVFEIIPLTYKYLKINKKYILASLLGLSLAMMVVSQLFILSNGNRENIYNQALENGETSIFQGVTWDYGNLSTMNFTSLKSKISDTFVNAAQQQGFKTADVISSWNYVFQLANIDPTGRKLSDFRTQAIRQQDFEVLKKFPNFPSNVAWSSNVSILVISSNYIDSGWVTKEVLSEFPNFELYNAKTNKTFTYQVDGLWLTNENDWNYATNNNLRSLLEHVENRLLSSEYGIIHNFSQRNLHIWSNTIFGYIDMTSLLPFDVKQVVQKLEIVTSKVLSVISTSGLGDFLYYTHGGDQLQKYVNDSNIGSILLLLVALPMVGLTLYLVYFSLNLTDLHKKKAISIMKLRGMTPGQIKFLMVMELLTMAALGSFTGMLISIPFTQYVIDTSNIYGTDWAVKLPYNWYWVLPIIGVILSLDLNINGIVASSDIKIGDNPEKILEKTPIWRKFYLDFVLTFLGIVPWVVIREIPLNQQQIQPLLLVAIFSLPFFVLGIPLLFSRFYIPFLEESAEFLWKRTGNIFALGTRNIIQNKSAATKLSVLLIIGMMFSFISIAVPYSIDSWSVEKNYYQVGSDFRINGLNTTSQAFFEPLNNSKIASYSEYRILNINSINPVYDNIKILGVNTSTFPETAFWQNNYAPQNLKSMMTQLSEGNALIESNAKRILNLDVQSPIILKSSLNDLSFYLTGEFKYWPLLVEDNYFTDSFIQTVHIVTSLQTLNKIQASNSINMLVKAKPGTDHQALHADLVKAYAQRNLFKVTVVGAQASLDSFTLDPVTVILYAMFNSLLLITSVVITLGVVYFAIATLIDRKREFGVLRALGLVSRQIYTLLLIESIVLVSTALIMGSIAGSFLASNLFIVFGNYFEGRIPPIKLVYPPVTIALFTIGSFVLAVISAMFPGVRIAKSTTGPILRAE